MEAVVAVRLSILPKLSSLVGLRIRSKSRSPRSRSRAVGGCCCEFGIVAVDIVSGEGATFAAAESA